MRDRAQDVSLNEMRTLVAALETGTFTGAAKRLGVTQPAVSRLLIKLESRLGFALFERDARHLSLTPTGEKFAAYARDMLAGFDQTMAQIRQESMPRGELRIGASTTLCDFLVLGWVRAFSLQNPEVTPRVFISDSDGVEEDVLDGASDVGFIGRRPLAASLRMYAVADDEVVLAVPANHQFAARGEIDLQELCGQPFITRERASGTAGTVASTLRDMDIEQPERRVVMSVNSAQACLQAVAQGFGISWVSQMPFQQGEVAGVRPVHIRGIRFQRKLYLIHTQRVQTPVARAFVHWLLHDYLQMTPSRLKSEAVAAR